ncbi:S8 family serine peptidase [Massilia eburnea]|uniref:S8 family serine peptidase n=1 Tax=Massilia eburnea TaxID=1776165 RepID=UPI003D6C4236
MMKNFPQEMSHASGASLALDTTRLLIALKQPKERSAVEQFLHSVDLFLEDEADEGMVPGERVNHTKTRYFVQARRPLDDGRLAKIEEAGAQLGIDWIGPVYRQAGQRGRRALMSPLPHVALVKLRQRDTGFKLPEGPGAKGAAEPAIQEITEKTRYLNGHHYLQISNVKEINAYQLRERLRQIPNAPISDFQFETMPLLTPTSIAPNDTLFPQQWDMTRIEAGGPGTTGWDITTGAATTVVCVLDEGCDLTHPDLRFAAPGINLGTMSGDGSPTGNHGTACAGIVAATYNNGTGVTGVAGDARILPVAFDAWTDVEVAAGINYASANGASIIRMSFGWNGWSPAIIDPAIQSAFNNDLVMCVATHNYNGPITYPATNPLVIAVGASDEVDNRKTPASPDGEPWGSNFGPQISVVSPGVHIPTTDRQGAPGYNATDYDLVFNGTSSATPHVAGLAALIRSVYPMLDNAQVRAHIERTAQKVGAVAYADTAGKSNGSWNQEMGYGRINVFRALDEADVMIKDAPADTAAVSLSPAGTSGTFQTLWCASTTTMSSCPATRCSQRMSSVDRPTTSMYALPTTAHAMRATSLSAPASRPLSGCNSFTRPTGPRSTACTSVPPASPPALPACRPAAPSWPSSASKRRKRKTCTAGRKTTHGILACWPSSTPTTTTPSPRRH